MPSKDAAEVIASYPAMVQQRLRELRGLIFETAKSNGAVGPITETLKWGEPAYLTETSKSGSTIRIGWKPSKPDQYAMYFNCQTTLVDDFRTLFPELTFEGNRALVFQLQDPLPKTQAIQCIELALTYHSRKKKSTESR